MADLPTAEQLDALEHDPAAGRAAFASHRAAPPDAPLRLAYELAAWACLGGTFAEHLRGAGIDVADAGVAGALLRLTACAAAAEQAGTAGFFFHAWLAGQAPHPLSREELDTAIAVHNELLAADADVDGLVRAVLRRDPDAGALVRAHVGIYNGADLVAFLHDMRAAYPRAQWVAEIARDLPSHATVGDLADEATRELLVAAMVELGGVAPAVASASITQARQ